MEPCRQVVLEPRNALVLGGDLGGTSTRIVIADSSGTVLGRGTAGGGNPTAHPASAAAALGEALAAAVAGLDGGRVAVAVLGAAGGPAWQTPPIKAELNAAWSGAGLTLRAAVLVRRRGRLRRRQHRARRVRADRRHRRHRRRRSRATGWSAASTATAGCSATRGPGSGSAGRGSADVLRTLDAGEPVDRLGADIAERLLGPDAPPPGIGPRRGLDQLRDAPDRRGVPPQAGAARRTGPRRDRVVRRRRGAGPRRSSPGRPSYWPTPSAGSGAPEQTTPLVLGGSVVGETAPVGRHLRELLADRFAGTRAHRPLRRRRRGLAGPGPGRPCLRLRRDPRPAHRLTPRPDPRAAAWPGCG